jgi:hypothetical protein
MDGILLNSTELSALLHTLRAKQLVGVDTRKLVPADPVEYQKTVQQGMGLLQERGWTLGEPPALVIHHDDLMLMGEVVAFPEVVALSVRIIPGTGQQHFLHYLANGLMVEFSQPAQEQYRLAAVPNIGAAFKRWAEILPLPESVPGNGCRLRIEQEAYFMIQEYLGHADQAAVRKELKQAGMPPEAIKAYLASNNEQSFYGTLALLRIEKGEVSDARNLAIVCAETSWMVRQVEAGQPLLELSTACANDLKTVLRTWLAEFSAK